MTAIRECHFKITACRDADVVVYSVSEVQLAVYETKPAIFDLVLAAGIAAYLGVIYYAVMVGVFSCECPWPYKIPVLNSTAGIN